MSKPPTTGKLGQYGPIRWGPVSSVARDDDPEMGGQERRDVDQLLGADRGPAQAGDPLDGPQPGRGQVNVREPRARGVEDLDHRGLEAHRTQVGLGQLELPDHDLLEHDTDDLGGAEVEIVELETTQPQA